MAKFKGTSDADVLFGTSALDTIYGYAGNDFLLGSGGADTIYGGKGSDFIVDGNGQDILYGGNGKDIFSFVRDGKKDKIKDFQDGKDMIDLSRLGVKSFDDVQIEQRGGKVLITAGKEKLVVSNATVDQFDADDFVFKAVDPMTFDEFDSDVGYYIDLDAAQPEYKGFSTQGFGVLETDEDTSVSGYIPRSGDNVAYNGGGNTVSVWRDDTPFDLESGYFSAAWRDDLRVVVSGYLGDELVGYEEFTVSPEAPKKVSFNDDIFDYVTEVHFTSFGGNPSDETDTDWIHFSVDNLLLIA